MSETKVNEDLVRERKKCTFNVQELIHLIDGGEDVTKERKEIEEMVLSVKELTEDEVPEEYLSHKERYERAAKKAAILTDLLKDHMVARLSSFDAYKPSNKYRSQGAVIKDISPFRLHMDMFVPTIFGQGNDEQVAKWLPKALSMEIIGTYAQTELGHGTFLRGMETTATYDSKTKEFVLNSPTLTSYKWWPGGLGQTVNHCVVVAQLYTNGKCHGVHPFIVQIRDLETHIPLPGVKVGDIGPKMGFQTANNGFLGFDNFRIPRDHMLMKNAQVLEDGTYQKAKSDRLTYGTMVLIRVMLVTDVAYEISRAATIAVRYSAVRHQSKPRADGPEPQIIDYLTQQHKIFIAITTSHAFRITGLWIWDTFSKVMQDMKKGNLDKLAELHAAACCLKAVCSQDTVRVAEQCRLACGGHGYMISSCLPIIYSLANAVVTLEGEYTVLLLQTARFLVKSWKQAVTGNVMTPIVSYLVDYHRNNNQKWQNTPEGIIKGFQAVAAGKTKAACESIDRHTKSGRDAEDSWNLSSVQLCAASEAHCRTIILNVYWNETQRLSKSLSASLGQVLQQLAELYLMYWSLERAGDLLMYTTITKKDVDVLQQRYEQLLALIRPNAVGLVDSFDIRDEILSSTLGASDGRVYERLMEEAMKSPLNKEPVNQSFQLYLKPLMIKGKM